MKLLLLFGDFCFCVGALMDVVLSYFWIFKNDDYNIAKVHIIAACFWLFCAVAYMTQTIWMELTLAKASNDGDTNDSEEGTPDQGTPEKVLTLREGSVEDYIPNEAPPPFGSKGVTASFDSEETIDC